MIGVYIHIPYCRRLCPYCDFVRQQVSGDPPEAFTDALCREIASFEGPREAGTLFIGGGTPSIMPPDALARIFKALERRFAFSDPVEATIEANPDDVAPELAQAWADLGINRVSLGVQSFSDAALSYLGRRHDAKAALRACETVAEHFANWSMDLIFGARPIEAWEETLDTCRALRPPHVSAYGLTFEEGTPFARRAHEAVDDETYLDLYRLAAAVLDAYERYEISNYAFPGYACRHNLIYWRNEEYVGFGPGAYSFIDGVRARNTPELEVYYDGPGRKTESLDLPQREVKTETLIQHFRLAAGIDKGYYRARFGSELQVDFGDRLAGLVDRGLLVETKDAFRPTDVGFELNNEIGLALVGDSPAGHQSA